MTNAQLPKNPAEAMKQMNILYLAMLVGQVMIFVTLYFINQNEEKTFNLDMNAIKDPIFLIALVIAGGAAMASIFIYTKRKEQGAKLSGTLMEKLGHYRQSLITRIALLEGSNLGMILFYFFIKTNVIFLFFFVLGLLLFLQARPTVDRIVQDYQLSDAEQNQLRTAHF